MTSNFLAVARTGTVSQASRRMGVDHATVTRRLDNLEKTLGSKLLERNPRGYNLTKRGERLLASARSGALLVRSAKHHINGAGFIGHISSARTAGIAGRRIH